MLNLSLNDKFISKWKNDAHKNVKLFFLQTVLHLLLLSITPPINFCSLLDKALQNYVQLRSEVYVH